MLTASKPRWTLVSQAVITGIAGLLLFWGLGEPYLWQDEAATAVLAMRMLRLGRPLAYDGVNLIDIDDFAAENSSSIDQRTKDPRAAIDFYVRRGDIKPDTTWKWQPWGQFVVAALAFKVLGATTLAARLPFAMAGVLTVLMLYRFVLKHFRNSQMAILASGFLVLNAYWILHNRQCRYYSLSSFLLLLTLASYARWQWGGRSHEHSGGALFVLSAWIWFQVDYGTFWPVMGILFADAFVAQWRMFWRPALVGGALAVAVAPFIWYYELWGRFSGSSAPRRQLFVRTLFNMNEYVAPGLIVAGAITLLVFHWKILSAIERRLIGIACAIVIALLIWVPAVAPAAFLRYVIMAAPVGSLLVAWVLIRVGGWVRSDDPRSAVIIWAGAVMFVFTPWLNLPLTLPLHLLRPAGYHGASILRPEIKVLFQSVFGHRADPNGLVIDWLKRNTAPDDEILINYEDVPLMFYLPNPIRGGVAAFRVEDDAKRPPDYVVLRHSVEFVHWPVFMREVQRYSWSRVPLQVPDVIWGNSPDPLAQEGPLTWSESPDSIFVARRVASRGAQSP